MTVRRVPPYFSMPLQSVYEVKPGSSLNITCVAGGSPMPYVKWRKGLEDLEPEHSLPIGRNILVLEDIQESANYTCVASSKLGQIENTTFVRVEGKLMVNFDVIESIFGVLFSCCCCCCSGGNNN